MADDALISRLMEEAGITGGRRCCWSRVDRDAPLFVGGVRADGGSTIIDYRYRGTDGSVVIPFTSPRDVENAFHCLAVLLLSGLSTDDIAGRMGTPVGCGHRPQRDGRGQQLHAHSRQLHKRSQFAGSGA